MAGYRRYRPEEMAEGIPRETTGERGLQSQHRRGPHTMTLSLNSVPSIEDLPPERVRGLLRRASTEFTLHWLAHALRSDTDRARVVVVAMERAGLVVRDQAREAALRSSDPYYRVTLTGRSLARASGAKRIERVTAEKTLTEFMERVIQSNANQKYLYSVTRVAVFGSYLEDTNRLGDVDVAVDLQPRIPLEGNWVEVFQNHAENSGRSFATFEDAIDWPRREVSLFLKSRKRSVSIQSWFSFVQMEKSKGFQYEVLLGDEKEIALELKKAAEEYHD